MVGQPHTEDHCLVQDLLKTALNAGKGNFLNDNASAFLRDISNAFVCPAVQGLEIFRWLDHTVADNNVPHAAADNGQWVLEKVAYLKLLLCKAIYSKFNYSFMYKVAAKSM